VCLASKKVRNIRLLLFDKVIADLLIKVHKAVTVNTWARRVEVANGTALPAAQRYLWVFAFTRDATHDHFPGSCAMLLRRIDNENAVVVSEARTLKARFDAGISTGKGSLSGARTQHNEL
jgi:hypothetical protein